MDISVRDPHNDMIKPYDNGGLEIIVDSVTQKVLISDTALRSLIPTQCCKMTPKLRQICGYVPFIFPKDMHIGLNRFRTGLVTYLKQNSVGRHTRNILLIITSA